MPVKVAAQWISSLCKSANACMHARRCLVYFQKWDTEPARVGPAGSGRTGTGPASVARSTPWTARCRRPETEPPGPGKPRRLAACALASSAESAACLLHSARQIAHSPPQTIWNSCINSIPAERESPLECVSVQNVPFICRESSACSLFF